MVLWQKLGWLALAGALGTIARFGLSGLMQRLCGPQFPWGTFTVNALGCFLFGLVWALAEHRGVVPNDARFVVLVGFMGAFTTFSTFAFETSLQLWESNWWLAAANLALHNVVGIALVGLGVVAGRAT